MNDREQQIVNHLRSFGRLSVGRLAELARCSQPTIRRSLQALESRNLVVRTPGGAMPVDQITMEVAFPERLTINAERKRRIAAAAATHVQDGQVLVLDNGSSVYLLAEHLNGKRNLTIITYFLPLVNKLSQHSDWKIILTGGQLRNGRGDLIGPLAEEFLSRIYADVAFFGADGLDLETGVSSVDPESAALTQTMCKSAARKVLLADSTKLSRRAAFAAINWDYIDRWTTDREVDRDLTNRIREKGVDVELV